MAQHKMNIGVYPVSLPLFSKRCCSLRKLVTMAPNICTAVHTKYYIRAARFIQHPQQIPEFAEPSAGDPAETKSNHIYT